MQWCVDYGTRWYVDDTVYRSIFNMALLLYKVWSRLSELDVSPHQQGRRALIPLDDRRLLLLVTHCPRLNKLNLTRVSVPETLCLITN